jgi:hypothetical protein
MTWAKSWNCNLSEKLELQPGRKAGTATWAKSWSCNLDESTGLRSQATPAPNFRLHHVPPWHGALLIDRGGQLKGLFIQPPPWFYWRPHSPRHRHHVHLLTTTRPAPPRAPPAPLCAPESACYADNSRWDARRRIFFRLFQTHAHTHKYKFTKPKSEPPKNRPAPKTQLSKKKRT